MVQSALALADALIRSMASRSVRSSGPFRVHSKTRTLPHSKTLSGITIPFGIDLSATSRLAYKQREGRIQSAERAVPTFCKFQFDETSFSLKTADSRHMTKGASYA